MALAHRPDPLAVIDGAAVSAPDSTANETQPVPPESGQDEPDGEQEIDEDGKDDALKHPADGDYWVFTDDLAIRHLEEWSEL